MQNSKKILIAPLDWGLGHSTRCIPLIRQLLEMGHEVTLASSGKPAQLLHENFPEITIIPLEGYNIHYSNKAGNFTKTIIKQIPKIIKSIRREHGWLKAQQAIHQFDAVISDNRYGLHLDAIPCAIMTHQLRIQSGKGRFVDAILQKLHNIFLQRFHQCWVVDVPEAKGLSGELGHPKKLPKNASYIGLLSQFSGMKKTTAPQENQILVLLSGPEPMRSQLEKILWQQVQHLQQFRFVFVAGNPGTTPPDAIPEHVKYFTHLTAKPLLEQICAANLVVCRSGYSTVMDLTVLNKKALLLPTPGQTEQEYLAAFLSKKNIFHTATQETVDLATLLPDCLQTQYQSGIANDENLLRSAIARLLGTS